MLIELQSMAVAEAIKADGSSHWISGKKLGFADEFYNLYWIVDRGIIIVEHKKTKEFTITTVANCRELKPKYDKESKMNKDVLKLLADAAKPDFQSDVLLDDVLLEKLETIIKIMAKSQKTKLTTNKLPNP